MEPLERVLRRFETVLDERAVDDELRGGIGAGSSSSFHLLPHRLEVALHPIDADGERILQVEVLRSALRARGEIPVERHVSQTKTRTRP